MELKIVPVSIISHPFPPFLSGSQDGNYNPYYFWETFSSTHMAADSLGSLQQAQGKIKLLTHRLHFSFPSFFSSLPGGFPWAFSWSQNTGFSFFFFSWVFEHSECVGAWVICPGIGLWLMSHLRSLTYFLSREKGQALPHVAQSLRALGHSKHLCHHLP